MTSHGATMLPSDFDIFLPSGSAMWPRHEARLVASSGRTAASRSRSASRTSRASGRSPRRCSPRGTARSNLSWFSNGACHWANGIEPESNQTSITSGTRRSGSPPVGDGISTSSTYGRCGSSSSHARELLAARRRSRRQTRLAGLVAPDRQRRAPVALAPERPVDVVLQPAPEAAVLDVLGVPVDGLVGRQQPVLDRGRADVPGRLGVVEQRRAAAPAVRVGVQQALGAEQPPARLAGPRSGRRRRP